MRGCALEAVVGADDDGAGAPKRPDAAGGCDADWLTDPATEALVDAGCEEGGAAPPKRPDALGGAAVDVVGVAVVGAAVGAGTTGGGVGVGVVVEGGLDVSGVVLCAVAPKGKGSSGTD